MFLVLLISAGCSKYMMVPYNQIEKTNSIRVKLAAGPAVKGIVENIEPHQLTVIKEDGIRSPIPKAHIYEIWRLPPVYDDLGMGISEAEISQRKRNTNALVYGIGGGALCAGASFFAGSMIAKNMEENGGAVMAGTTVSGGGLGTFLFIRAGAAKDRSQAIDSIRDDRLRMEFRRQGIDLPDDQLDLESLEEEKKRNEAMRKERERLLRELKEQEEKK